MARALWTDEALQYIADIYKYIAKDSPQNAETFLNTLMDSVEMQLSISAEIGRVTPEFQNPNKREIIRAVRLKVRLHQTQPSLEKRVPPTGGG
jgi:plasmid stabilization system protein ParE